MDPKFLRDEAARLRDMAETQDREASKLRLLKMAADYEIKADAADKLTKANSAGASTAKIVKKSATEKEEAV
jgi:hypothetical protein